MVSKLPLTDREIISNILDGLLPQQQSRFVFETIPTTWPDIDRLCIHDGNILFS
jgi:hypothetical protein